MGKPIRKTSTSRDEFRFGKHRFEHWHVDNQVYFLTARCRERFPAFASEDAKAIFWDRFEHYAKANTFTPWVVSLLDNHYHALGHLQRGDKLPTLLQRLHGSVAKLVNDILRRDGITPPWLAPDADRRAGFWGDAEGREYFDGCLRDLKQGTRTYRYVYTQCRRHGVCDEPTVYAHTRVYVPMEEALRGAMERHAFLEGVPYPRYSQR